MRTVVHRLLLLTVVVLAAAACGQGAPTTEIRDLSAAADATQAAGTARVSFEMRQHMPGMSAPFTVKMLGIGALDRPDAAVRYSVEGPTALVDGDGEMRVVDGTMYVSGPLGGATALLGQDDDQGRPWVQQDLQPDTALSGLTGAFTGISGSQPGDVLDQLRSLAGTEVTPVGEEQVRGETTTRYRAVVPGEVLWAGSGQQDALEALEEEAGDADAEQGQQLRRALDAWLDTDVVYELWIAADGMVRRLDTAMDFGPMYAAFGMDEGDATLTMTMELWDFGVPLTVEAPPADQVREAAGGLGGLGSTASASASATVTGEAAAPLETPDGLPDDFPLPDDVTLVEAQDGDGLVALTWHEESDGGPSSLADRYAAELTDTGWVTDVRSATEDGDYAEASIQLTRGDVRGLLVLSRVSPDLPVTAQLTLVSD